MKRTILLLSLALYMFSANAVPAKQGVYNTLTLADGTKVIATLHGDEHMHYWETKSGDRYVLNSELGYYEPADMEAMMEVAAKRRLAVDEHRAVRRAKVAAAMKTRIGDKDHIPYVGKKKGLIILAQFQDKSFGVGHNKAFYERVANELNFTHPLGFRGSVKDYFLAQSDGTFELDFDVVGPITLPNNYAYYGAPNGSSHDSRPGLMVATACQMVDDQVDFTQYDWDGDGYVDQVFVLYAGPGQASGGDENTIWPHEWNLSSSDYGRSLLVDGVGVNTYACGCEITFEYVYNALRNEYQRVERTDGIGTICHEFSHCLGFPDAYDTQGNNYGMGRWDVMAAGSYNGRSFCPPNYTAYERMFAGWQQPVVLNQPTTVKNMKPLGADGQTFIIYNDGNADEYYLIENRQLQGWDTSLYGKGMLAIHIDYDPTIWQYNLVNANISYYSLVNDHQRYTIFHADNDDAANSVTALEGDPYPYVSDGIVNNSLTNTSTPAAILYTANSDGTYYMNKPITNITQNEDGTISFDFMGGSDTNVIDGISAIYTTPEARATGRIYSLDGRYMGKDLNVLERGIYIRDGKKIVR